MTSIHEIRARFASRLAETEEARAAQLDAHNEVREAFTDLAMILEDLLPAGRYKALVNTALEEAAMWANKAVASPHPVYPGHVEGRQNLEAERLREGTQGVDVVHAFRPGETYGQFLERTREELAEAALQVEVMPFSEWGNTAETTTPGRIDEGPRKVETNSGPSVPYENTPECME